MEERRPNREKFMQERELSEARKKGTAAPAVDEEGKVLNPHMPHFIANVPWYYGSDQPTLKHHRRKVGETDQPLTEEQDESGTAVQKVGIATARFRRGACENCGAITHKTSDCLERPRKVSARFAGSQLAVDEVNRSGKSANSYDAKRDRWGAYDVSTHTDRVSSMRAEVVGERPAKRARVARVGGASMQAISSDEADFEAKDMDSNLAASSSSKPPAGGGLRLREDRARYLDDLDATGAHYDPKSRSIKGSISSDGTLREDMISDRSGKPTGDQVKLAQLQVYEIEMERKGIQPASVVAIPTLLERSFARHQQEQQQVRQREEDALKNAYGSSRQRHLVDIAPSRSKVGDEGLSPRSTQDVDS